MGTFSHSEVDTRNRCHRQWYYSYVMEIEPLKKSVALRRGTLGHIGLAAFFSSMKKGLPFDKCKKESLSSITAEVASQPTDYLDVMADVTNSLGYFFEARPFDGWKVVAVEEEFSFSVSEDFTIPVIVDLLIEDPYGDLWNVDNKFLYDFPSGVENDILPQLALYAGVCRANGYPVTRFAYSILRTRKMLEPSVENMYRFDEVYLTQARIERTLLEHAIVAEQCYKDKQLPIETCSYLAIRCKQPRICNMCDMSALCLAELSDHQPELVFNNFFKPRTRRIFKKEAGNE